MVALGMRWALLAPCLVSIATAQGLRVVNGQVFGSGLAIFNSPQPDTPLGGDTLHVSIEVTSNGRLELPPLSDNFRNGIAGINMFLTSTVTGLNLTISNGTFDGWDKDALETPEFLCNSTTNADFENAGCQQIMRQEPGSTVKHVNWVWPDCLVGNGGADNGNCVAGGSVEDCLDGTARGPYNISFHEALRINGSDFYTITDLPIRVTNSIPEDTQLAGGKQRPRCSLRNNPLIPYDQRNAAIRSPTTDPVVGTVPTDADQPATGGTSDSSDANDGVLDPGSPNSGSLGPDRFGASGSSANLAVRSQMFLSAILVVASLSNTI